MAAPKTVKCRGLYTATNRYDVPEGALVTASNILISKDGVIQPRWGLVPYATSMTLGNVSNWHKAISFNSNLWFAGRDTVANTCKIGYGAIPFAGVTLAQTEDGPDGYSTFTSTNTPYYDTEFIQTGNLLYYNCARGLIRVESTTVQRRAGNYPCAVSCIPRPFKVAAGQMTRAGTTVTVTMPTTHGYAVGMLVTMTSAGEANFANGEKTVTSVNPGATSWTYTEAGAAVSSAADQIFAASNIVGSSGFMASNDRVAYRAVLTEFDTSGLPYQGPVSGRVVVTNGTPFVGASNGKNVQLAIIFPPGLLAANTKVELYRSRTAASAEPNDQMGLVFTKYLHAGDVANGFIWVTDINPDATIGRALYTNDDQEGLKQSHEPPATAKTVAIWGNRLVRGNTFDNPAIEMQLLSTDSASGGVAAGDKFEFLNPSIPLLNIFTSVASTAGFTNSKQYSVYTGGTSSIDVKHTVLSLIDSINWQGGQGSTDIAPLTQTSALYLSVGSDWPGRFALKTTIPHQHDDPTPGSAPFNFTTLTGHAAVFTDLGSRGAFAPKLGATGDTTASVATRAANVTTLTMASAAYKFEVGEYVQLWNSGFTDTQVTIAGTVVEGQVLSYSGATLTISNPGTNGTDTAVVKTLRLKYGPELSNNHRVNNLHVSKPFNLEAFPPENTLKIGQRTAKILKCVQCKDSLLVFKEDGLFRVTASGVFGEKLFAELLDPNAILWAKDSAVAIQGKVMAWLTKGVAIINEQGVEKYVSERIQDRLRPTTNPISEPDLLSYPYSRRAQAFVDEVNGLYELRVCLSVGPSAPYASTINVIYDMLNDTWVEDDLAVVSEAFYQNKRYIAQGSTLYAQNDQVYAGSPTGAPNLASFVSTSTANVYSFSYTGSLTVGCVLVGIDSANAPSYVLTASAGTGTLYSPDNTLNQLNGEDLWNVYSPVISTIQWAPITFAEENKLKRFTSTQILMGVRENMVAEVSYSTELVSTTETLTCRLGAPAGTTGVGGFSPYNLRTIVPQQHRVAEQLNVKVVIRTAYGPWTILGLGVEGLPLTTRVNR